MAAESKRELEDIPAKRLLEGGVTGVGPYRLLEQTSTGTVMLMMTVVNLALACG